MSDHVKPLLNRLVVVFGQPRTDDVEMFLAEYARTLGRYALPELDAAVDRLLMQHRHRSFPTIAECVNAVHESRDVAASTRQRTIGSYEPAGWRSADSSIADGLCRSDIGRQAYRDGWLNGLHRFCAREHRLPNSHEQADIVSTGRFVDRCAAGLVDMGAAHVALLKLAQFLVQRRETIAARLREMKKDPV